MKIYLTRTQDFPIIEVKEIWALLTKREGPMKFYLLEDSMPFEKENFEWHDFFHVMNKYKQERSISKENYFVAITELSNSKNWFSAPDFNGTNCFFIHGKDWENFIYCKRKYPISYEIVANILHWYLLKDNFDMDAFHEPAIGCMSDLCSWKPDTSLKYRTGDICESCLLKLKEKGVADEYLLQALSIFSELRHSMLYSSSLMPDYEFDSLLPFNVAITKRKMSSTNEPLKKFLFLIDHFDSLIRTAVILGASIIFSYEERSQFFERNRLVRKPTLGSWFQALINLVRDPRIDIQLNKNEIVQKIQSLLQLSQDAKLIELRNEKKGHGYTDYDDKSYKEAFIEHINIVNTIEMMLGTLFRTHQVFFIKNSSLVGENDVEISALKLGGSFSVFQEEEFNIQVNSWNDIPIKGKVYLYNESEMKWFNLDPLFIYRSCPICNHVRLMITDGNNVYIDPLVGHLINIEGNN